MEYAWKNILFGLNVFLGSVMLGSAGQCVEQQKLEGVAPLAEVDGKKTGTVGTVEFLEGRTNLSLKGDGDNTFLSIEGGKYKAISDFINSSEMGFSIDSLFLWKDSVRNVSVMGMRVDKSVEKMVINAGEASAFEWISDQGKEEIEAQFEIVAERAVFKLGKDCQLVFKNGLVVKAPSGKVLLSKKGKMVFSFVSKVELGEVHERPEEDSGPSWLRAGGWSACRNAQAALQEGGWAGVWKPTVGIGDQIRWGVRASGKGCVYQVKPGNRSEEADRFIEGEGWAVRKALGSEWLCVCS